MSEETKKILIKELINGIRTIIIGVSTSLLFKLIVDCKNETKNEKN